VFNAVGDPARRDILDVLGRGEASVNEMVEQLDLSQPQVSKHLRVLRDVDLVRCRTAGRHRIYRVHGPSLVPLQGWLGRLTDSINEHYDRLDDYLLHLQNPAMQARRET
jgi:DNA-binding transcriptional ArsR family regulator